MREIFDRALELPDGERSPFVAQECAGDEALFREVQSLLNARGASNTFLSTAASPVQRIGRYVIHGELGRGGMGIVYDAVDPVIGRGVALKVIDVKSIAEPAEAELMRERLFREARSCGQLFHPGIVIIFDVGQQEQSAFIAMEKVDGPSLHSMLSGGRLLPVPESIRILRDAASALDYAHQHGIVHRDVKPANIMVRGDGAVKVADFGIAKVMTGALTTVTGVIVGTPSYMSPEQIEGRSVDGRSDQFSLAVLAFELLAGGRPFRADSLPTMAHLIVYGERPSPRTLNPSLPPPVDVVFQRAFARSPEDRFPTCGEFVAALQAAMEVGRPAMGMAAVQVERPLKPSRGNPVIAYVVAAVMLGLLLGSAYVFRGDIQGFTAAWSRPGPAAQTETVQSNAVAPRAAPSLGSKPPAALEVPRVLTFAADPATIKTGESATLKWDVTGADSITIDHGIGKASARDSSLIVPTTPTTYKLVASNSAGVSRQNTFIDVQPESIPAEVRGRQLLQEGLEKERANHADEAFPLFIQAAELGNHAAMIEAGECYRSGEGVAQDEDKAMAWFHRAADAGDTSGMVHIGMMYLFGVHDADPNDEEATEWFQKAADRGDPAGMYNLAQSYEKGHGVAKNLDKAKELYEKSAKLGNAAAQNRLNQLQSHK